MPWNGLTVLELWHSLKSCASDEQGFSIHLSQSLKLKKSNLKEVFGEKSLDDPISLIHVLQK